MANLSNATVTGLATGFSTRRVSDGSWENGAIKSIHGSGVGPKMVQLFGKSSESNANLSTGLDSDDDWQYDDKRDKGNYPITHAVRVDDNNLTFRSQGVNVLPTAQLEFGGLGVVADGALNPSTTPVDTVTGVTYTESGHYNTAVGSIAWNGNVGDYWLTPPNSTDYWVGIIFQEGVIINKFRFFEGSTWDGGNSWVLEGSLDGAEWVPLSTPFDGNKGAWSAYLTFNNSVPYTQYRLKGATLTTTYGSIASIELIEASLASTIQVDSITAGGTELLGATPLDLTGSSQASGLNDIIDAINNGPTNVTASQHPDYPTRIRLSCPDAVFDSAVVNVGTQGVALTKLNDFTAYADGTVTVVGQGKYFKGNSSNFEQAEANVYQDASGWGNGGVPVETDICTGGTAGGSNSAPSSLFDDSTTYSFIQTTGTNGISYDLGNGNDTQIFGYRLRSIHESSQFPKEWKFLVSGNGVDWVELDRQENQSVGASSWSSTYVTKPTTDSYRYIRFDDMTSDAGTMVISEVEVFSGSIATTSNTFQYRPLTDGSFTTYAPSMFSAIDNNGDQLSDGDILIEYSTDNGDTWTTQEGLDAFKARPNITTTSLWLRFQMVGEARLAEAFLPSSSDVAEDPLGLFPGAQIVDTLDSKYHITAISSDNLTVTVAETLPPDAEWEVKRIANAETFINTTYTFNPDVDFSTFVATGAAGYTRGNKILVSTTASGIRIKTGAGTSPVSIYKGVLDSGSSYDLTLIHSEPSFTFSGEEQEILFDSPVDFASGDCVFYHSTTGALANGSKPVASFHVSGNAGEGVTTFTANAISPSIKLVEAVNDNGFKVTTNGTTPDINHFHTLAPNGPDSVITKPTTGSQVTNFGFRLPDNSDWAVNLYGEEGYMAFATEFEPDFTPKNCVIYNKTLEQREVIASKIAADRGGLGEDGAWMARVTSAELKDHVSFSNPLFDARINGGIASKIDVPKTYSNTNIALSQPAFASSYVGASVPSNHAALTDGTSADSRCPNSSPGSEQAGFDFDTGTGWHVAVDLGDGNSSVPRKLTLELFGKAYGYKAYQVMYSEDNANWTPVGEVVSWTGSGVVTFTTPNVGSHRYWGIAGVEHGYAEGYGTLYQAFIVKELSIYEENLEYIETAPKTTDSYTTIHEQPPVTTVTSGFSTPGNGGDWGLIFNGTQVYYSLDNINTYSTVAGDKVMIEYDLPKAIRKASWGANSSYSGEWYIIYSDNGEDWTRVTSNGVDDFVLATSTASSFEWEYVGAHKYWGLEFKSVTGTAGLLVRDLTFYNYGTRVLVDTDAAFTVEMPNMGQEVTWEKDSIIIYNEQGIPYGLSSGMFSIEHGTEVDSYTEDPIDVASWANGTIRAQQLFLRINILGVPNAYKVSKVSMAISGTRWSPAKDQARAFAAALEASVDNRNPASYYTYQHPDMLTQEQFSKLFFGTDKFAPYVGVRSTNGGAPEFTNIWCQFSAALKDIKLGTGSVKVEPLIGSTEVQLTNVSGSTIDGAVEAYILG
jgi:hypothetical protein